MISTPSKELNKLDSESFSELLRHIGSYQEFPQLAHYSITILHSKLSPELDSSTREKNIEQIWSCDGCNVLISVLLDLGRRYSPSTVSEYDDDDDDIDNEINDGNPKAKTSVSNQVMEAEENRNFDTDTNGEKFIIMLDEAISILLVFSAHQKDRFLKKIAEHAVEFFDLVDSLILKDPESGDNVRGYTVQLNLKARNELSIIYIKLLLELLRNHQMTIIDLEIVTMLFDRALKLIVDMSNIGEQLITSFCLQTKILEFLEVATSQLFLENSFHKVDARLYAIVHCLEKVIDAILLPQQRMKSRKMSSFHCAVVSRSKMLYPPSFHALVSSRSKSNHPSRQIDVSESMNVNQSRQQDLVA